MAESVTTTSTSGWTEPVSMDPSGRIRLPRAGAITAALLRIGLGLLYLWAFVSQGLGVLYSNSTTSAAGQVTSYGWHFSYDTSMGWITSGFAHSPTAAFVGSTHGPLAFIAQN